MVNDEFAVSFYIGTSQDSTIAVDWGDGQSEAVNCSGSGAALFYGECEQKEISHKYDFRGEYQVTVLTENSGSISFVSCCDVIELDVSSAPDLVELNWTHSNLKTLDVSKNTALQILECDYCQDLELDVSHNTALKKLICRACDLKELHLARNVELEELDCRDNRLTNLDVSNNVLLEKLNCGDNLFTKLDVSKNVALKELDCSRLNPHKKLEELALSKNVGG